MSSPTHTGAVFLNPQAHPGRFSQCLVDVEDGAWVECVSNAVHEHEVMELTVNRRFREREDDDPEDDPDDEWPKAGPSEVC